MLHPGDTKISFQISGSSQPNRGTDMLTNHYDVLYACQNGRVY